MPSKKLRELIDWIYEDTDLNLDDEKLHFFQSFSRYIWKSVLSEKSEIEGEQLATKIKCGSTDEQRIASVFSDETSFKVIAKFVDEFFENRDENGKDNTKAKQFKENGNDHFRGKRFESALKSFCDAISLCPANGEELSCLYNNRSAALFHLKRYEDSLTDINRALKHGYQPNRCHLLFARKVRCLRKMRRHVDDGSMLEEMLRYIDEKVDENALNVMRTVLIDTLREEIQLEEDTTKTVKEIDSVIVQANKKLANAADCVEMVYSSSKGRHVVANCDIKPSTVLFAENPFAQWLKPSFYTRVCYNCLKYLRNFHYPCRRCSIVRFCDEKCEEKCWSQSHSMECEFLDIFRYLSSGHFALNILLNAGMRNALQYLSFTSQTDEYFAADYSSILSLVDHFDKRSMESICSYVYGASFLTVLIGKMKFVKVSSDLSEFYAAGALLLKHMLRITCNTCAVQCDELQTSIGHQTLGKTLITIGRGIYPSICMLNHSCHYTVYPIFEGSRMILKSIDGFRSGEEVTFNYGCHYQLMSFKDRREELKKHYFFKCECKACKQREENVSKAFCCRHCNGPLILNDCDGSNYCVSCGESEPNIRQLKEKFILCSSFASKAFALLDVNDVRAKESLLKSLTSLQNLVYWKHELLLITHQKLAKFYVEEQNSKLAMVHLLKSYEIFIDLLGENNYNALCCLMNVTLLLIREAKGSGKQKLTNEIIIKAQQHYYRCLKMNEELESKEYYALSSYEAACESRKILAVVTDEIRGILKK